MSTDEMLTQVAVYAHRRNLISARPCQDDLLVIMRDFSVDLAVQMEVRHTRVRALFRLMRRQSRTCFAWHLARIWSQLFVRQFAPRRHGL